MFLRSPQNVLLKYKCHFCTLLNHMCYIIFNFITVYGFNKTHFFLTYANIRNISGVCPIYRKSTKNPEDTYRVVPWVRSF